MYNTFYYQQMQDGTEARAMVTFESRDEAASRFHMELAQVGISATLKKVSAMVFDDSGHILMQATEKKSSEEVT